MDFIRSKIGMALIGLFVVGGLSAAIALATAPQPYRAALAVAGQTSATATPTSVATATATTASSSASSAPASAPVSAPAATSAPDSPPATSGNLVGLQGPVTSIDTSAGTFTMTATTGSNVTVETTSATSFQGDAKSLSALKVGYQVDIKGTPQANGDILATLVNTDAGN